MKSDFNPNRDSLVFHQHKPIVMRKIFTLLVLSASLFSTKSFAQKMFLTISGIEGSSTQETHKNALQVFSYSQGMTSCPPDGSGKSTCRPNISSLSLMVKFDKSNIAIKKANLLGTHLATADFDQDKAGGDKAFSFYKIHMEDVTIVTSQESNSEGSSQDPSLSIELSFSRIAWQYTVQTVTGQAGEKVTVGWDLAKNKPWSYVFPN
jgi:type VI secretion system Hcp family effector